MSQSLTHIPQERDSPLFIIHRRRAGSGAGRKHCAIDMKNKNKSSVTGTPSRRFERLENILEQISEYDTWNMSSFFKNTLKTHFKGTAYVDNLSTSILVLNLVI